MASLVLVDRLPSSACGPLEIPACHDVCVGVVVNVLVVLVGADKAADMPVSVGVWFDPRRPPARGLHDQLPPADLLNVRRLPELGAGVASIGGAGTFDGVFLTGIMAVVLVGVS